MLVVPHLPATIDPDAWLVHYDKRAYNAKSLKLAQKKLCDQRSGLRV
jgi:hypothetical protein